MTIFEQMHKLLPAHYALFDVDSGSLCQERYWKPQFFLPGKSPSNKTRKKHIEELDALLKESVALRLRSDVPLGIFLSGGGFKCHSRLCSASIAGTAKNILNIL
jgi:asparagine synthase (glutamine-hydrolysing)